MAEVPESPELRLEPQDVVGGEPAHALEGETDALLAVEDLVNDPHSALPQAGHDDVARVPANPGRKEATSGSR